MIYWEDQTLIVIQRRILERCCGDCSKWNTGRCPKETPRGMTGFRDGPVSSAFPCKEFTPNARFSQFLELEVMKKLES